MPTARKPAAAPTAEAQTPEEVPDTAAEAIAAIAEVVVSVDRLAIHRHRVQVFQTYALPAFGFLLAVIGLLSILGVISITMPATVVIPAGLAIFAGQSVTTILRQFVGSSADHRGGNP
jgi:hypothetical protein